MMIQHGLEQIVEQLADLAITCPSDGHCANAWPAQSEALQSLAGRIKEFSLDGQSLNRLVFAPLEEGLVARWGVETGPHLYRQIVTAFRDEGQSVVWSR